MGHCKVCDDYEDAVMAGRDDVEPCEDYDMSEKFKTWVVARMQDEVMKQVNDTGLNRMAIVKDSEEEAESKEGAASSSASE